MFGQDSNIGVRLPAERSETRIFRFADDAWEVPKGQTVCRVDLAPVVLVRVDGYSATETVIVGDAPFARRVSMWTEWFDLTLTNAAHAYLLARIEAHRKYLDGGCERASAAKMAALDDILSAFTYAEKELVGVAAFGSIQPHHFTSPGHRREYLARVKADIEARLSGEPGAVVQP